MRVGKGARWALVVVAAAALVFAAAAAARTHATAKGPIVIGWAHDSTGAMGPFDGPALAAAKLELKKVNKKGVNGRKVVIKTCDTQGNDSSAAKACADQLISQGAKIIFTTCDVNYASPVIQESASKNHLLTVAPCIGTDQMSPKFPFCGGTKLCFSFGNVAQDEGSAMAQVAWNHGWKTADLAKDNTIIYFDAVINAFKARFKQLGGKIKFETTYQDPTVHPGSVNYHAAAAAMIAHPAKVIVTATAGAYGALGPFMDDLRTANVKTPVLNSWAGDGTYWTDQNVTNYWFVTYANAFGHDPSKAVNGLAKALNPHPATGGFITGPAAIDGVVLAIKRANGSLVGSKLAAVMQKFHKVPTISGKVSFSPSLHSVFGRAYRVIELHDKTVTAKGTIVAKKVPHSPDQP
ncbi:MAG TPA: ABC transporter substrate-binding protein [Gaiellaceae bacterium]|jgi:ABC-type branched-subunit amino acid transport system substrate-binding protein